MSKVALYLRLSQEDGQRGQESESIANQREFLLQYAAKNGLRVEGIYTDDGYSGTSYERPGFRRMLADIERGVIDVVVTKDLSRLGRDYILTGHYLERYFPERGVRYIAVSDNIDTEAEDGAVRLAPFLSVVNDMYAQDISRKVRSALSAKKNAGRFIGAHAPYGYAKSEEDRGKLVPDEASAAAVREVFRDYLECGTLRGTARRLTESGIVTPSWYRRALGERAGGEWSPETVKRILTNPTYAGHLTQNRARKISYKVDKKKNLPRSEWITVPNTHEAIIGQEEFDRVQEMLRVRSYRRAGSPGHLLTGLAYCGDCGSAMTYVRESAARTYMVCQGYRAGGQRRRCSSHTVREDAVIRAVVDALREQAKGLVSEADIDTALNAAYSGARLKKQLGAAEAELEVLKKTALCLYKDRTSGAISESEYQELSGAVRRERRALETRIADYKTELRASGDSEEMRRQVRRILEFLDPDRAEIVFLVEKILIFEGKELEVCFRFAPPGP